ncbi:MFS superfamily sulfate permease-like transporter [Larkinella arboricola]|uniref:MFS superfamily sulfate permease-like transporter n=1 Tax=Larkinella arboricola TaxID=643671 RepID=A0A327WT91_LARAB|nr:SulP family inorganic anion transporter [Larkinella arboricola]RAJ95554.1 MFS superfamily sulfate permease-like transporter [Larkinella arboricola]
MNHVKTTHTSARTLDFSNVVGDIRGGVVSFLVAVPLCLGIALASGAPLFSGIIAGIVGGLVVGLFSRSALSISGPEAGLIVVTLAAIESLGSFPAFLLATCLAGLIQVGLGYLRAGSISNFFPSSVIKGMLAGIGVILIIKQIPHLVGYDADSAEEISLFQPEGFNILNQFRMALEQLNGVAVLIAALSLIILLLWERPVFKQHALLKNIPGALVVVVLGIGINGLVSAIAPAFALKGNHLVQLPVAESFSGFFGLFTWPDFDQWNNPQVYASALSIALVASLEALLAIEASDQLDPLKRKTPTNAELKAQGIGNLVSGLIGGIPLTSVIVRSSVSINAGARTKLAALLHGTLLLVCVIALPSVLNQIPWAALASILLITGYKLARISIFKQLYNEGIDKFIPFVATVVAILLTDLLTGIALGMLVALFFILRENYRNAHRIHVFQNGEKEHIRISMGDYVSFLSKASMVKLLTSIPDNAVVEIDSSQSSYIDSDVMNTIYNFRETALKRNIQLVFLREPISDHKPIPESIIAKRNRHLREIEQMK